MQQILESYTSLLPLKTSSVARVAELGPVSFTKVL